jgi:hypothetical protein
MKIIVFDCESNGLYGECFAVGAVVYDTNLEKCIDRFELKSIQGQNSVNNQWVIENVIPHLGDMKTCKDNKELRTTFYNFLQHYKGARVFSDVNFPVETGFLSDIVKDEPERQWNMPYPLEDIATKENINIDRAQYFEEELFKREPQKIASKNIYVLRKHHPLDDATASLYFLLHAKLAKTL